MAATNKFKNWMAAKLGSILRREITPDEITLGPSTAATGTKTALVEITYNGEKHVVVYDKFPISELFAGGVAPVAIAGEITSIAQALPLLNARYGLDLKDTDVVQGTFDKNTVNITFDITPSCYEYTGKLLVPFTWTGPVDLETPLHEWLLQDNLENTGQSKTAITGITLGTDSNGKWGRLNSLAHLPLPASAIMSRTADYTIDFEVAVTAIPTYMCLLTTSASAAGAQGSLWWYGGRFYEYGVSSGNDSRVPLMKANTPQRITLVRKNSKTSMYIDGVFIIEYNGVSNAPFIGFHDGDSPGNQFPISGGLRKLRFWQKALSAPELAELFKITVPKPLHQFLLNGNNVNTGTDVNPLTMNFTYEQVGDRMWGKRMTNGRELLGPGVQFDFSKPAILDMELNMREVVATYRVFFTVDPNAINANGTLMTYMDKLYHAGIGYSGLPEINARAVLPKGETIRLTMRLKGTTMYVYVNTVLYMSYPFSLAKPYIAIGDADSSSAAYSNPSMIRAISYWPTAMSDAEFNKMLSTRF